MKVEVTFKFDNEVEAAEFILAKTEPAKAPRITAPELKEQLNSEYGSNAVTLPPLPTPAPAADAELDAAGLPWDKRIHASSKAINADGTWRYRRGVEDSIKDAVEAELKAQRGTPAPTLAPIASNPMYNPATGPSPSERHSPPTPPAPPVAQPTIPTPDSAEDDAPSPTLAPEAPAAEANPDEIMVAISEMVMNGEINTAELTTVMTTLGVSHIGEIKGNPIKAAEAAYLLRAMGKDV